jgi:hypothetical protein
MKNTGIEAALTGLLEKYGVETTQPFRLRKGGKTDEMIMLPGYNFVNSFLEKNQIPLFTWRSKRKFIELKKIVEDSTIEDVVMFRFCSMGSKNAWDLSSLLYRELDLCEFIGNGKIVSVQASISGNHAGSAILRLSNNILCSVELSICMPINSEIVDRHEIIARRGVASDLAVDTMVPQNSIYSYTENGEHRYRDVDMELFGYNELEIDHIRSAFQVFKQPELMQQWKSQHERLINFVKYINSSEIV